MTKDGKCATCDTPLENHKTVVHIVPFTIFVDHHNGEFSLERVKHRIKRYICSIVEPRGLLEKAHQSQTSQNQGGVGSGTANPSPPNPDTVPVGEGVNGSPSPSETLLGEAECNPEAGSHGKTNSSSSSSSSHPSALGGVAITTGEVSRSGDRPDIDGANPSTGFKSIPEVV